MHRTTAPLRLGLTGGIGSGKSTVAALWRAAGHRVIDLDAHSRRVLDVPGQGVEEAVARFGEEFRAVDGTIDRAALARLVFADAAARADLERIVLTRVDTAVAREEAEAARAGERVIVHDSPLLLEKGHEDRYGAVVAVLARREGRIDRLVRDRAGVRASLASIVAAQASDPPPSRRADRLALYPAGRRPPASRARRALAAVPGALPDPPEGSALR